MVLNKLKRHFNKKNFFIVTSRQINCFHKFLIIKKKKTTVIIFKISKLFGYPSLVVNVRIDGNDMFEVAS